MTSFLGRSWVAIAALVLVAGCGLPSRGKIVTQCVVGQDQTKTFLGRWAATPIKMALYQDPVSDLTQDRAVTAASLDVWNSFSKVSFGFPIIDYRDSSGQVRVDSVGIVDRTALCRHDILSPDGKSFLQPVMIHKRLDWPYDPGIIALTTSCPAPCPAGSSCDPIFRVSMIEINFRNYFADGKPQPDAMSILVHEVGHMLGLGHSCEYSGSSTAAQASIPDCNSKYLPKSYKDAVMFPQFAVFENGPGEVRYRLNGNDMGRVNCLYK